MSTAYSLSAFFRSPNSLTIIDSTHLSNSKEDCPICLKQTPALTVRTKCHHIFHEDCLTTWLQTLAMGQARGTCPCCRTVFFEAGIRFELPSSYTWEEFLHYRYERTLANYSLQDPRSWPLRETSLGLQLPTNPPDRLSPHGLHMLALQAASLRLSELTIGIDGLGQTEEEPTEDSAPLPP
jgi:hypothetical protein